MAAPLIAALAGRAGGAAIGSAVARGGAATGGSNAAQLGKAAGAMGRVGSAAQFLAPGGAGNLAAQKTGELASRAIDSAYLSMGMSNNTVARSSALDSAWGGKPKPTPPNLIGPASREKPEQGGGAVQPGKLGLTGNSPATGGSGKGFSSLFPMGPSSSAPDGTSSTPTSAPNPTPPYQTPMGGTGTPSSKGPYDVGLTYKSGKKSGGLGRGLGEMLTDYNRTTKS